MSAGRRVLYRIKQLTLMRAKLDLFAARPMSFRTSTTVPRRPSQPLDSRIAEQGVVEVSVLIPEEDGLWAVRCAFLLWEGVDAFRPVGGEELDCQVRCVDDSRVRPGVGGEIEHPRTGAARD